MDMMSYVAGKESGAVVLTKVGFETYQMVAKRFDGSTGKETFPEILSINRKAVAEASEAATKALKEAQDRINGVNALVKDLDALDAA